MDTSESKNVGGSKIGFNKDALVSTTEVRGLVPKGNKELRLTGRVEIFEIKDGFFRCNVWFLESYKMLPTLVAINADNNVDFIEIACDKSLFSLEDSLEFDTYLETSIDALQKKIFSELEALFFQEDD